MMKHLFYSALTALCVHSSLPAQEQEPEKPPAPEEPAATEQKPANEEKPKLTQEEFQELLKLLSSDDFDERESAQHRLWKAGRDAEDMLSGYFSENGGTPENAEVEMRTRRVLDEFSYGIYPDTPKEIISLIQQFRRGSFDERQMAITRLTEIGNFALIFKLMGTVDDREQRERLSRVVARHTSELVRTRILEDNLDEAERILRISAVVPDGMRNYAVFCYLQGRIPEALKTLETENLPEEVRLEQRHWIARVSGDLKEARRTAEALNDESLIRETLVLEGDLAAYCRGAVDFNTRTIRVLAHKAALARYTGDTDAFSTHIQDILKYSTEFPEEADSVYEALVLNGRSDEALEVARKDAPLVAFNHLLRQERYKEALAVFGIEKVTPPYDSWLDELCNDLGKAEDSGEAYKSVLEAYNIARFLVIRGMKEEATDIMKEVTRNLGNQEEALANNMCNIYLVLEMHELLFDYAEKALANGTDFEDVVADIFRGYHETAFHWSTRFPEEMKNDKVGVLRKIMALLIPKDGTTLSEESEQILADTEAWVKEQDGKKKDEEPEAPEARKLNNIRLRMQRDPFGAVEEERDWHRTLGQTYAALDRLDDARRHFQLCRDADIEGDTHIQVADYAAMKKQWKEAAESYRKAWDNDNTSELYLYLTGWALYHEGGESKAEGEKLMHRARLLMLASSSRNAEVASMLWQQGDADLAEPVARLVLRIASPNDADCIGQAEYLNQHLRYSDQEEEAVLLQERVLLYTVSRSNSGSTAMLVSRSWIEVLKARAALRRGDKAAALESIDRALKLTPGDSSALEDFHPMLVERGFREEADALFDKAYPVSKKATELFPNYDQGNNNHAWLLARCKRNLDEALKHAEKALEIDPDSAATTDTLAEVYYAKGEFAKAAQISDKALELLPTDAQLRKQNERFHAALKNSNKENP